jgi:hypothetical protein
MLGGATPLLPLLLAALLATASALPQQPTPAPPQTSQEQTDDDLRYTRALNRLIDLANRASVVFYTVDSRGLQPLGPQAADDTTGSPAAPLDGAPLNGVAGVRPHQVGARILTPRADQLFNTQAAANVVPAALTDRQGDPAIRRFRRGPLLDYGFVVYNAKPERATRRPRLTVQARLFREGRQVYAGQPQPLDPAQQTGLERIEAAGRLQLGASLAPGEYVLQVVVTDALADKSRAVATQWIDFELVN